jgi:4-guanidinobutyraldehyde dehydrogenase/NAD-dependent aldehyde dehydrogenase
VDVPSTARCIAWYAEAVDKVYDEIAPTGRNALALITREPMGVVGAIVPWNYPMIMAAWKLGPALAAGNSVVLKPSEKSPLTAMRLAELAVEAGLPPGVSSTSCPAYGHEAGEALALHMDVDAIGFTGSTRTGRRMLEYAGRSNLKRVYNELGGKSAFVVFDDFADIERAATTVAGSMFFNQGESCNAPSACWCTRASPKSSPPRGRRGPQYQPADPLDAGTVMGALVDETQLNTVMGYIEAGHAEGARCVAGGQRVRADSGGYYVEPTVFDGVATDEDRARRDLRPGAGHHPLQDRGRGRARWPTPAPTACRPACGATTSTAPTAWRARCAPAPCTSTSTTKTTSPCPLAATSKVATAATRACTPLTSTPS